MQPPSFQSEEENSSQTSPRSASRVRTRSRRPEKYSVHHAPRYLTPAATAVPADPEQSQQREAKFRRRLRLKRRLTPWEWAGFAASCLACLLLMPMLLAAQNDFQHIRQQAAEKELQLGALARQRDDEKNRLAHLKSEKGREQLLAERGYLKPGDRILLFAADKPAAVGE